MPSVSGPDNSYYYQKQISDISDENSAERKRLKQQEDARIADLEAKQEQELREKEKDYGRSITRSKEASNSALSDERETSKLETNRFKHDTYDRFGRTIAEQSKAARIQADDFQNSLEGQQRGSQEQLRKAEDHFSERLADNDRIASADKEKAIANVREEGNDHHLDAIGNEKELFNQMVMDKDRKFTNLDKSRLGEMADQRHRYEAAFDEAQAGYNRKVDQARVAYEKSTNRNDNALRDQQYGNAAVMRDSHQKETNELRGQVRDLVDAERQYSKTGNQGREDAIRDHDNEWTTRLATEQSNSEREIANLKNQNNRTEEYLSERSAAVGKERETTFAHLLGQQGTEAHRDHQELTNAFQKDRAETQKNWKADREMQQRVLEDRLTDSAVQTNLALTNQAKTMQETSEARRKGDQAQMQRLQSALIEHQTSGDTSLVSPAAEDNLRKQIGGQYEKTATADQNRRLRENDQIRDEYKERFRQSTADHNAKETQFNRTLASTQNDDRNLFNSHVADLQYDKDSTLRAKDEQHARESENVAKNYSRSLARQTQTNNETLAVSHDEASTRMAALREEMEFNQKMQSREYSIKLTEANRESERKLATQKSEYETRIDDMKNTSVAQQRDAERKFKNSFDELQRNSDQKLAQQEAQHNERERYITQTFQDELEKMKRANAKLMARRSNS